MARKKNRTKDYLDVREAKWQNKYAALIAFKKLHGHVLVGIKYQKAYPALYIWAHNQRKAMADGKLNPERVDKLNAINFIWNVKDYFWNIFYEQAKTYYHTHGNISMTEEFMKKNKSLSKWITHQREYWLHHRHLTIEKIIKLHAIGFTKPNHRDLWSTHFKLLKEFYKKNGHFDTRKGTNLHRWAVIQRTKRRQKRLPQKNIERLIKIGFPWNYRTAK